MNIPHEWLQKTFQKGHLFGLSVLKQLLWAAGINQTSPDIQCKDEAFDPSQINASVSFHWLITLTAVTSSLEMWQSEQDHWPNTGSQCHSGCPSGPWLASSYCSTRAQVFYSSNVTSARHLQTPWIPHQGISNDTAYLHWGNWMQFSVRQAWKPKDPKLVSQIHNYFKIVMRSSPVISGCFNWQVFNWSMQSFFSHVCN